MSQKLKENACVSLVYLAISTTTSTFAREGCLKRAFLDMDLSSDRGILVLEEGERIYREY